MKHIRRIAALLMCLLLLPATAGAQSRKLPLQDAHRVTLQQSAEQKMNGVSVFTWHIETAQEKVSEELNSLVSQYAEEVSAAQTPPRYKDKNQLDVAIRHSRTGLTWLSFMVQSRYVLNDAVKDVRFTTRTYDMSTGEQVLLTDIFPADSEAWAVLETAVRDGVNLYYPELTANAEALENACRRETIEKMDFTLHGMSLVLHLHAADFYPGKEQLIEVTLFYPDIRMLMTEKAQAETDNLTYYDTIALTFDDGPNKWVTKGMLNMLLKTGERATFFLVGSRMKGHVQYVMREHDEGHAVATHNYQHVYADKTSGSRLRTMAEQVDKVHLELLGIKPRYARAPGGIWGPIARAGVGWPLIQWSSQGGDIRGTQGREPSAVLSTILHKADDGGILLMHDMKSNSIISSEMIIERLQQDGYIFLTIDELFAKDGVELQPNTAYWRCQNGITSDKIPE